MTPARRCVHPSAGRLLTISSTPLPVLDWSGRSTHLSLAGLRLYDRDAMLLCELLALNTQLISLDLSQ